MNGQDRGVLGNIPEALRGARRVHRASSRPSFSVRREAAGVQGNPGLFKLQGPRLVNLVYTIAFGHPIFFFGTPSLVCIHSPTEPNGTVMASSAETILSAHLDSCDVVRYHCIDRGFTTTLHVLIFQHKCKK